MTADRVPLDETSLRHNVIGAAPLWRRVDVVAETGSTNADLIARAQRGEVIDGAVLVAENQTAGRGRQGRSWSAVPYAQITVSVGVDVAAVPTQAWGWLPLATGVAIVDAVADTGVQAGLKWPNDVLAGDGKLAGILAEVAAASQAVVVGIGLNVSLRGAEIEVPGVTSLVELGVPAPDRQALLERMLHELGRRIESWRRSDGVDPALVADYRARSLTLGTLVRAMLPGGQKLVGIARDIDDQGRLDIDADGALTKVSAGDIVHLRPAQ